LPLHSDARELFDFNDVEHPKHVVSGAWITTPRGHASTASLMMALSPPESMNVRPERSRTTSFVGSASETAAVREVVCCGQVDLAADEQGTIRRDGV